MSGMENSVLAFLAAVGIAALIWLVAGLLLWNRLPEQLPMHWNAAGQVRTLHEVRTQLGRSAAIAIVDCGLTAEGRRRAELLSRRFSRVTVLSKDELEQIIE